MKSIFCFLILAAVAFSSSGQISPVGVSSFPVNLGPNDSTYLPGIKKSGSVFTTYKFSLATLGNYFLSFVDSGQVYRKDSGITYMTPHEVNAALPTTLPPNGTAGGSLSGTYPNPAIAPLAISNGMISNSAAIAYGKLNLGGSIALSDLSATGTPTSLKYLSGGNTWVTFPTALPPNGTAGGDLIGTYPNPTLLRQLAPTPVKTANYTAVVNDFVACDNTAGAFTVTLPAAPADKSIVGVKMIAQSGTNAITIAAAGSDVFNKTGGSTSLTLALLNQGDILQYKASTGIWYVLSTDAPLGALDARYTGIAAAAGGDLTGNYPNPTLNGAQPNITATVNNTKLGAIIVGTWTATPVASAYVGNLTGGQVGLTGLSATGTPSANNVHLGNNTWGQVPNAGLVNSNVTVNGTSVALGASATITAAPSGSAGGDLTGTYPNPTIATKTVTVNGVSAALGASVTITAAPSSTYLPQMVTVNAPSSPYVPNSSNGVVTSRLDINITGLAGALTFSAPTGSWTYGQLLVITIKDAGSAETLSWNAAYIVATNVNSGALPNITVPGHVMQLVFKYYAGSTFELMSYTQW